MYLHLGKGTVVSTDDIIGIFDLEITSQSHITRKYLAMAEKAGQVVNASEDIPKSFVVCGRGKKKNRVPQPNGLRHAPETRRKRDDMIVWSLECGVMVSLTRRI